MREFNLQRSQTIRRPREEVFSFFADARNLGVITPAWLKFKMVTPGPVEMASGTLIDYTIKLHGFPIRWQSEITAWDPPHRFVDEQRVGPYRFWIHEHAFDSISETETRVRDSVRYGVPGGRLVQRLFVSPDLERVFAFRARKLEEIFS